MILDLAGVEQGEVIPENAAPKRDFLFLNYYSNHQYEFRGPELKARKLKLADQFHHSLHE